MTMPVTLCVRWSIIIITLTRGQKVANDATNCPFERTENNIYDQQRHLMTKTVSVSNHWPVLNSTKLRKNVEILQKQANSTARLKVPHPAVNCGP